MGSLQGIRVRGAIVHQNSPFNLVTDVEVSHLHQAGSVFLHGLIRDAHRRCVIAMDWSGRLRMSHFRQRKS